MTQNPNETIATTRLQSLMIGVAGIIILLDQISKYLVEAGLPLYHSWTPLPAIRQLRISHTYNTGAAFGLFPANSALFAGAAVLISFAILYYNYTLPAGQKTLRLALGLQLGGAIGNLIDRLRLGHVTDFVDLGPWVFNIADAAIVLGAFILALVMWQDSKEYVPVPTNKQGLQGEAAIWDE